LRLGLDQLAVHISGELRLIRVHRLGHAHGPALKERDTGSGGCEFG